METKVVSIPFVAGINEYDDPDQLQPPELISCKEAVIRRPGRIETRHGFTVVGDAGVPATAFSGATFPSYQVEAIESYYGENGTRAVLAAGEGLYEYVGVDSGHGWRWVNRITEYVGTLHGVTATGGSMIEVETMLTQDETIRVSAWVSGTRTGQELSSDLVYRSQVSGEGNSVYYAVQDAETGAFIVPPTRVNDRTNKPTLSALNLRMIRLMSSDHEFMLIAWRSGDGKVEFAVINPIAGLITATTAPWNYVTQLCYRSFDCVSLPKRNDSSAVFVFTQPDTGDSANPSKLAAEFVNIDTGAGGILTTRTVLQDIINHPTTSGTFNPWAHRGVELHQDPPRFGVGNEYYIAFAARVISRWMTAGEGGAVPTNQLDGQIWLGRMVTNSGHLTVPSETQSYVPFIGFQTQDDHSQVLSSNSGGSGISGSASISLSAQSVDPILAATLLSKGTPVATATLADGTKQTYLLQLSDYAKPGGVSWIYVDGLSPYHATGQFEYNIGLSGLYPTPIHTYGGASGTSQQGTVYCRQINWLDTTTLVSNATWGADAVITGCTLQDAGGLSICTATVLISGGAITEIAIEDANIIDPGIVTPAVGGFVAAASIIVPGRAGTFSINCYTIFGSDGLGGIHIPSYKITDIQDTTTFVSSTSYKHKTGLEHCVHRWSVAYEPSVSMAILALSSTSANVVTDPNGNEPFGAADPHAKNNFFEVYKAYLPASGGSLLSLNGGTKSDALISALGGPWRLVGSLCRSHGLHWLCAISPSGDKSQRSTFLIDVGSEDQSVDVTQPGLEDNDFTKQGATAYTYAKNIGMFVESCNMMRVTAVPLNTPTLSRYNTVATLGALRDGSTKGTESVFAIDYENTPQNWRKMQVFSDYTFVNGGVPSVFDGVNVNEITSLVWPQSDLCSVNWPWQNQDIYMPDPNNASIGGWNKYASAFWNRKSDQHLWLLNITRPYFKYEAGLKDKNGFANPSLGCAWYTQSTRWGGDPSKNYETVYADPRVAQFSQNTPGAFSANSSNLFTHYYGRYQSYSSGPGGAGEPAALGDVTMWLWAPRAAYGWDTPAMSAYTPAEAGGDFLLRWVYEYTDGTGRTVQSAPSNATTFTICAEIMGAPRVNKNGVKNDSVNDPPTYMGGLVSVFQYGFYAPRLELTNRLATSAADPRRVLLQPYATAEPYATVLYRMPVSNFINSSNDFVIGRNLTRGVVAYTDTCLDGKKVGLSAYPQGYVTNNLRVFDGPTKAYNGMLSEPFLYTTGNVLDNEPPPACKAMCVHQNRLVIGGADDPTVVWYSKPITATDGPGFNDQLTITIGDGGPVMGLASLNGNLIIAKYQDIYIVPGTLPDATGYGPSLGEPFNLPAGVGCIDHRSMCETPVGVFFQSTRGIELLTPALDVVPMTQVRETIALYPHVTSVVHYPANREVWFMCHDSIVGDLVGFPSGVILVFNYQTKTWSTFEKTTDDSYFGRGPYSIGLIGTEMWLSCACDVNYIPTHDQAFAYRYDTTTYYDTLRGLDRRPVTKSFTTAPIALNNVQGFQRIKRFRLLGSTDGASSINLGSVQLSLSTDYSATQLAQWNAAQLDSVLAAQGRAQLEVHLANQKGQKVQLSYQETAPNLLTTNGFGIAISNAAVVVGLKAGLDKRITTEAKH